MSASIVKKRPLSRYIKDFKHSQTHCAHCHKTLDRISLVFNDDILNKEAIADMTELVDESTWGNYKVNLLHFAAFVVRFIAIVILIILISCHLNSIYSYRLR